MRARLLIDISIAALFAWAQPAFGQSRDIRDYVLLALNSLALKDPVVVGNLGVNRAGGDISFGGFVEDGWEVVADTARISDGASVYDLYANSVTTGFDPARVRHAGPLPVSLPLISPLPPFPGFSCGGSDLIVGKNQSVTVAPGSRSAVNFKDGARVTLQGGTYNFCGLELGRNVLLRAGAASVINVVGDVRIGSGSRVEAAAGVDPIVINVRGSTVDFGKDTVVTALLDARFAEVALDNGDFVGRIIADNAHSDFGLTLTLWEEEEPTPTPTAPTPTSTVPEPTPTPTPTPTPIETPPAQCESVLLNRDGPSVCRLVPYYEVGESLATLIGFSNTSLDEYMLVHVAVFDPESIEQLDFDLCLSEHDFGFVVLQKGTRDDSQVAELAFRGDKAAVLSLDAGDLDSPVGYVTLCARRIDNCTSRQIQSPPESPWLYAWTILQDIGTGFFATEVPTPPADADFGSGEILSAGCEVPIGGVATRVEDCLIPPNRRVGARYDVNPLIGASSSVIVWLSDNALAPGARCSGDPGMPAAAAQCTYDSGQGACKCPAQLRGEDEGRVSTRVPLTREVNVVDPSTLAGIGLLTGGQPPEYRGILELRMPASSGGAGFLFSFVDQEGLHYRETFLGYDTGDTSQP